MGFTIAGGNVVTETGVLSNASILVEAAIISEVGTELTAQSEHIIQASGCYVFPGFIDLHVHGGAGADVMDRDEEAIAKMCRYHAENGTTSMLLTTRSAAKEEITEALQRISSAVDRTSLTGAQSIGIHLEGPFINDSYKGAQSSELIQAPSLSLMKQWYEASQQQIKIVTLAPELEGADEVIAWLIEQGVTVSAGHCGPDFGQMTHAIERGVSHITHCFNGMRGFSHRDPGMLAALMMSDSVTAELIMDTIHVHPDAGRLLLHAKGSKRVALITDAMRAAGLQDGEYESAGGRKVTVKDGIVRLPSGNLAGSTLTMNRAVQNAIEHMGASLTEAADMASLTPARVLGLDGVKGSIRRGKDADLVIMDSSFNVLLTVIAGQIVYRSPRYALTS